MQMGMRVLLGLLLLVCTTTTLADRPPNIVFVLVDDMGYGDVGCMGGDVETPHIDRLASEGVKFTSFYANAPVCSPTRCGFITGRWQQRVGFEWALGYTAERRRLIDGEWTSIDVMHHGIGLPNDHPGIAKMLSAAGYTCGAFGKWHLGYDDEYNPLNHGFHRYFGELLGHSDYYRHIYYDGTYTLRDGLNISKEEGYLTDLINHHAAKFVRDNADKPFFLYVPHLATHAPFQPPDAPETPKVTKANMLVGSREIYKQMLQRIDLGVGMIMLELEDAGVADNTLFVFSSDNGGERWANNQPLFHHKATLWEGGIRVPCLMRWPEKLPEGKVTDQAAITMDLTATFTAAAGAKPPEGYKLDGINLIPILTGEQPEQERTFYWRIDRSNRKMRAIRHGQWKYLDDGGTMDLLFDLSQDIGERHNLCFTHPEIVADLKERLKAWEAEMEAEPKTFTIR
ncbi:MAG: sulfatase-like hydrolase/transferase [Planctomycetaceae bacterium]|nr:sulfatase-like hydrolase/transferase [Planctomycetaceae bacterium]